MTLVSGVACRGLDSCVSYCLPFGTCFAVAALFFFWFAAVAFACFWDACLCAAFGDLSPMIQKIGPMTYGVNSDVGAFSLVAGMYKVRGCWKRISN